MSFVSGEKIQDGTAATLGQFPFVVSISIPAADDMVGTCTGFIIGKRWIVSAAHCTEGTTATASDPITINAGVLMRNSTTGQMINVTQWYDHPKYDFPTHDITLLKLSTSLTWNSNVQPITMSWEAGITETTDMSTTFVGYGTDQFNSTTGDLEYTASTNSIASTCSSCGLICVTSKTSSTVCQGDSGGPLLYKDSTKGWVALGTLSNGGDCKGTSGIKNEYTSLNQYKEFITCILSGADAADCDCSCGSTCSSTIVSETQSAVFSGASQTKSMTKTMSSGEAVYQNVGNCTFSRKLKKMCTGAGGEFSCETVTSNNGKLPRGLVKCEPTDGSFSETFSVTVTPTRCVARETFYSNWCTALGGSGECTASSMFVCEK